MKLKLVGGFVSMVLLLVAAGEAQVTCRAVAPGGSGTGLSWTSPLGPSAIGSSMTRGFRYYLADGSYGATANFTTALSGTTTIEVRKAQSYDFGRSSDGCSNDISAGWNAGTMGSSQAVWAAVSGSPAALYNFTGYYIINGNGAGVSADVIGCGGIYPSPTSTNVVAPPSPAGCGIKFDDSACVSTANQGCGQGGNGINNTNGNNVTVEYTEQFGNGGRGPSLSTAGGTYPNEYYWWWVKTPTNTTITHNYYHNMMTTYALFTGGATNVSIDHNYFWGMYDQSTSHAEGVQLEGTNTGSPVSLSINNNIFRDQTTNGDVVQVIGSSSSANLLFYNNVDVCTNGTSSNDALYGTSCNHTQGMLSCINVGNSCVNWTVVGNTMAQVGGGSGGTFVCGNGGDPSGDTLTGLIMENNLWYNCGSFLYNPGSSGTWDYNAYLNSGRSAIGAHDTSSSSSPNPFTALNATSPLLSIVSENALWDTRVSLGSPYDTDIIGTARTSDRGAYQFVSGTASFSVSPATVPANSASAFTITITGSGLTSSATFTVSGVSGTTISSCSNTSTSGTCQLDTGSSTGTLTITDTTDSVSTTIAVATETFTISPTSGTPGSGGCTTACQGTISFTGSNSIWSIAALTLSVSGSGCAGESFGSPTITSNTTATATLIWGSAGCTETVTDTSTGATATFTVAAATLPSVTTGSATTVMPTTATVTANSYVCTGSCGAVTSEGTCYATSANPTTPCTSDGTSSTWSSSLSGLTANTTYHYRAFASNSAGTAYGSDTTFTTPVISYLPTACSDAVEHFPASGDTWTQSCTPANPGDAIKFFAQCHPTSGTITGITLTAPGYTVNGTGLGSIVQIVPPASTGSNSWGAIFGVIALNNSNVTFTATFTGASNCTNFGIAEMAEYTGNLTTGGTATFNASGSASGSSGTCNQSGAAVTPPMNNEAVSFACLLGSATTATSPWTLGATDGNGNSTEYQLLSGGLGSPQTPAYNGSSGAYIVEGVAIAPAGSVVSPSTASTFFAKSNFDAHGQAVTK